MYEELIQKLKEVSANKYVIREAEELADRLLREGGYFGNVGATPVVTIANKLGFKAFKEDISDENISGNIFVGGTTEEVYGVDKVIVVSSNEEHAHQRFIIAHELGHYLMDYLGGRDHEDENKLFAKTYPKISHDSPEEIRADRFAAELLMPREVFSSQYMKAMIVFDFDNSVVIKKLAAIFAVKESSIRRRIEEIS